MLTILNPKFMDNMTIEDAYKAAKDFKEIPWHPLFYQAMSLLAKHGLWNKAKENL